MELTPNMHCGECSVNLAWDNLTSQERETAIKNICTKCGYYKEVINTPSDCQCVCCGRYAVDGMLCWNCQQENKR